MQRNIHQLSNKPFDVLVIGGGIHGAVTAWDAALRGLSVALIERGDFGSATSQNSLKTIHGGLRYLQDGNLSRIRKMAYERTTWMKIAPHLVHPFPCLTITQKKFTRSQLAMRVALAANDLLSYDRNRLPDPEKHLPGGKVISRSECARLLPGYEDGEATGAAVWHDAQIFNSERLLLEFVQSAWNAGAQIANYVEATSFLREGDRITGVQANDHLSGQAFEIHASVVINCAGAWINGLLEKVVPHPELVTSVALNLVVDKIWSGIAAGLPSHPGKGKRSQVLFIVPWRNKSMIGTWHIHWNKAPDTFEVSEAVVQDFLDEINTAHPRLKLTAKDVRHVQWGFLPVSKENADQQRVRLERDDQVIDHQTKDALSGLISVVSVKYTTARVTAEKTVDLAVGKLAGKTARQCQTAVTPVEGGKIEDFRGFLKNAHTSTPPVVDDEILEHLIYTYGSKYQDLLKSIQEHPDLGERLDPASPVTLAEVVHAVRDEMAFTLKDVIQRRTELGAVGLPSFTVVEKCAERMAFELGWDDERQQQEITSLLQAYPFHPVERVRV